MHRVSFQRFYGAVVQALATVDKVGTPAQWHGKIEKPLQFFIGKAIRGIGVWKLTNEEINLFHMV